MKFNVLRTIITSQSKRKYNFNICQAMKLMKIEFWLSRMFRMKMKRRNQHKQKWWHEKASKPKIKFKSKLVGFITRFYLWVSTSNKQSNQSYFKLHLCSTVVMNIIVLKQRDNISWKPFPVNFNLISFVFVFVQK